MQKGCHFHPLQALCSRVHLFGEGEGGNEGPPNIAVSGRGTNTTGKERGLSHSRQAQTSLYEETSHMLPPDEDNLGVAKASLEFPLEEEKETKKKKKI